MSTSSQPVVFVVDDDKAVRKTLSLMLKSIGMTVETYPSATAFLDAYRPSRPGCLILDVRMPGITGTELQEMLAQRQIDIPIIIITGHGDVRMAVRAVRKGAVDFIEKPFDDHLLLNRVQEAIHLDARRRHEKKQRAEVEALLARLTPREHEVMDLLAAGMANKEIAFQLGLSRKTVDIHRAHVMMKLGIDSLTELVRMQVILDKTASSSLPPGDD